MIAVNSYSQSDKHPFGIWVSYTMRTPVGKKLSWNNDVQLRFQNTPAFYDYTLVRSGLQYQVDSNLLLTAGVLYGTDNVNEKKLPAWQHEYRLWQDLRYFIGKQSNLHAMLQLRMEERWFDIKHANADNDITYATRLRLRCDIRKPLSEKWKLVAGNELMYQHANAKIRFNQNRIWFGGGYMVGKKSELQVQLMQVIWDAADQTVLRVGYVQQF